MKKKVNQRVVIFTKDYTNKLKGTVLTCDAVMASHLIQVGVAELVTDTNVVAKTIEAEPKPIKKTKKK